MIRWCAYCQSYQGEQPPYADYSVTHTLCARCAEKGVFLDEQHLQARIEPIAAFYRRIWALHTKAPAVAEELLDEGLGLGIAPFDLLVGILQPALYDVGDRWARGEATVEDEHRLTALCVAIIERLEARYPELTALRSVSRPDVLLVTVGGNTHTVGIHMVEFYLLLHGVSVRTVPADVPKDEIVRITRETKPRVLGIGATLPEQLAAAERLAHRIADEVPGERPIVRVGGGATRDHSKLSEGTPAELCHDFRTLVELVSKSSSDEAAREPRLG